jgi:hypothetical protein
MEAALDGSDELPPCSLVLAFIFLLTLSFGHHLSILNRLLIIFYVGLFFKLFL